MINEKIKKEYELLINGKNNGSYSAELSKTSDLTYLNTEQKRIYGYGMRSAAMRIEKDRQNPAPCNCGAVQVLKKLMSLRDDYYNNKFTRFEYVKEVNTALIGVHNTFNIKESSPK